MATALKGKYRSLEQELGEIKAKVPAVELNCGVVEAFARGRLSTCTEPKHLMMSEALKLGPSARRDLEALFPAVITPLGQALQAANAILSEIASSIGRLPNPEDKVERGVLAEVKDTLSAVLANKAVAALANMLEGRPNIKAVIFYPIVVYGLNSWRKYDFEFVGRAIESVKAREPDPEMKAVIGKMNTFLVGEIQIRRN